ncbi:MAG: choice-of-anchor D domain-containing protein [Bryobacteraceae bacterium]
MNRFTPILLLTAMMLPGQTTTIPLTFRVQVSGAVQTLTDNGTVQFNADAIGRPLDATVSVTNRGTGTINISRVEVTGSTDFTVIGVPAPELAFLPNEAFSVTVRFRPGSGLRAVGAIRFFYTDTPPTPPGGRAVTGSAGLNLNGVAPDFAFTYLPPPSANATPILAGGTIAFPATGVNETATAAVVIINRGAGPGTVGVITSTGAAYSLAALPNPPTTIDAGREVRFSVRYSPTVIETSTGAVSVELVDRTVVFNLTGSSTGAVYSYELVRDAVSSALARGATVAVPDVAVGEKSSVTVRVTNTGNADGRIAVIGVQGAGFSVTDAPFLPALLTPGSAATVAVTFTPTAPGRFTGRLRVGDDSFDVVSNGLGSNLTYSYVAGPVTTTVTTGGSVIFPPVAAGQTSSVRFVITNTGTSPAAVNSVGIVATGTTFVTAALPALPMSLAPGQALEFGLMFAPVATGSLTGTLRVDSLSFTLTGLANQPPAIPAYQFSGASGAQQPAQQLSMGLALAGPYPLTLRGTLTLAFNSDVFANDPAVQFAVGGRTVNFSIPAGQRDAVFATNQTQVRLQTGTVAGSIVLTPAFQSDGGIALTPADPPSITLTVAPAAPRLLSVQVTGRTATGLQLLVTGFATSRQISQIDLAFTGVAGENIGTTRLTVPAEASFNAWYQSAASAQFGSQFTATIPLTLQGDLVNVGTLIETLRSVSATLTNRIGASAAASVDIQ